MADAPEELAILAAGAPPTHPVPLAHLRSADVLVCCDGAYAVARRLGREADYVVGDGDSLSVDDRSRLEGRFVHVSEQDTNDLAKAFRFAVTCRPRRIVILGATGLREDHALGNIFWLFDFVEAFPSTCICTDTGTFEVVASERTFACSPGTAVSVFVPDREARVASKGLAWPLDGVRFTDLHCATLNRAVDASFTLAPTRPALVYIAHGVSTVRASASSVA